MGLEGPKQLCHFGPTVRRALELGARGGGVTPERKPEERPFKRRGHVIPGPRRVRRKLVRELTREGRAGKLELEPRAGVGGRPGQELLVRVQHHEVLPRQNAGEVGKVVARVEAHTKPPG